MARQKKTIEPKKKKKKKLNYSQPPEVAVYRPPDNPLLRFFWPEFEELPVALISFSMVLLMAFNSGTQKKIQQMFTGEKPWLIALILIGLVHMIWRTLFHVFSRKEKTRGEKKAMVGFAAACCGMTGILGGMRVLSSSGVGEFAALIAVLNVTQGMVLSFLLRFEYLDENSFSDRDTPLAGALVNFFIIAVLFAWLQLATETHWFEIFSLLLAYSMTFASPLSDLIELMFNNKKRKPTTRAGQNSSSNQG
ncbi:MAG: hypothetical protein ACOYXC_08070 [Candidatus Rifleibacteriota bacterium]